MSAQFTYNRRVQFAETDMAGIVHFSNYYRYMEETEHAYFRSLGLGIVHELEDGTILGWPRVRASCSYTAPAFYNDVLEIDLHVARKGVKSLTMSFQFRRGSTLVATGELKTVCCICRPGGKLESIPMPELYNERIQERPAA